MSKGSRPRPFSIPLSELNARHEAIFGVKPKREQYIPPPLPDAEEFDKKVIMKEEFYDLEDGVSPPKDSEQQG
jgi:hypothetical protein